MTIKSKQMISLIIHFLLLSEVVPRKKVLNGQKILSSVSTTLAYYFGFFPAVQYIFQSAKFLFATGIKTRDER